MSDLTQDVSFDPIVAPLTTTAQQQVQSFISQKLPFCQDILSQEACLVGGAVRDALLGRNREYLDLDFVLPTGAIALARAIANQFDAGFVVLDAERQIARVVFKDHGTLDFAQQEGADLITDLRRRDFTINAIAYNLHRQQLIDPLDGITDLENRRLRMIRAENLADDPLRLLRAYRQAAQLGLTIESNTRQAIRELAPLLGKVAAERVQAELDYLLRLKCVHKVSLEERGARFLKEAWQDHLLKPWFDPLNEQQLDKIAQISSINQLLSTNYPEFNIDSEWQYLAKLTCLVSLNHEIAVSQLTNLKYSRNIIRAVSLAVQYLPQLQQAALNPLSLREQYFFFLGIEDIFPILSLFGLVNGINLDQINYLLQAYFNPDNQVAHPTALVTGNDLIQKLNLKPSPQIGKLLTEIQIARIEGKVITPDDAIQFAQGILQA